MDSNLKIVILCSEYPPLTFGGLGSHVAALARRLGILYERVEIFVPVANSMKSYSCGRVNVNFISSRRPIEVLPRAAGLRYKVASYAESVRMAIEKSGFRPSLIHCHDWFLFEAGRKIARSFGIPLVHTLHSDVRACSRWGDSPSLFALNEERKACTQADATIAVSHALAGRLQAQYPDSARAMHVVHNGTAIICQSLEREAGRAAMLTEVGLTPSTRHLAIFAGRICLQKGLHELLEAARDVISTFPNAGYVIIGNHIGDEQHGYAAQLNQGVQQDRHLHERCVFVGRKTAHEIRAWYQLADIALVPSVYEPFGLSAIEAMAAGAVVVASNTGGLREIVEHDSTGILVPLVTKSLGRFGCDVSALANAQKRLFQSADLIRALRYKAYQRVVDNFSISMMINKTTDVYRRTLTGHG